LENKIKRKTIIGLSKEYELSVKIVYSYYDLLVDYLNKIGLSNKCESEFLLNCLERVLQERSSIVISNSYVEETRDIKDAITPEIDIRDQYDFALKDYYDEENEWKLDHEREEAEDRGYELVELPAISTDYDLNYTDDLSLTIAKVVSEELGSGFDYRKYEDSILTDEDIQKRWFNDRYYNIASGYRKRHDYDNEMDDDSVPVEDNCFYDEDTGNSISGITLPEVYEDDWEEKTLLMIKNLRSRIENKMEYFDNDETLDDKLKILSIIEDLIDGENLEHTVKMDYKLICDQLEAIERFTEEIEAEAEIPKSSVTWPLKLAIKDPYRKERDYIFLN